MKKRILTLIVVALILSILLVPVAFAADQEHNNANGQSTQIDNQGNGQSAGGNISEKLLKWQEKHDEWVQRRQQLLARRMELAELRTATHEQLREQQQIMLECKDQIKQMLHEYKNLGEDEQYQAGDQLQELRRQMLEVHLYNWAIRYTSREQIRNIFSETRLGSAPEDADIAALGNIAAELA